MRINSNIQRLWLMLLLSGAAISAKAEDPVDRSIITMGVSYGYYHFHDNRELDNRDTGGGALGLQFTKSFSMALRYFRTIARQDGDYKRKFENYFVEGAWYFNTESNLRPYIVTGLGETLQEKGRLSDDTSINAGVGIKWIVAPSWAVKLDWREYYSLDEHFADQELISTLEYRFGAEKL